MAVIPVKACVMWPAAVLLEIDTLLHHLAKVSSDAAVKSKRQYPLLFTFLMEEEIDWYT